jgi:hypothetical protein
MSYSLHIIRQSEDGSEIPITYDEWNTYVVSDPDFRRPQPGHLNYSNSLVLLPSDDTDPDNWEWLSWGSGRIYSDYPQQPMLKKMGQVGRHFGAIFRDDDGQLWKIDDEGNISPQKE